MLLVEALSLMSKSELQGDLPSLDYHRRTIEARARSCRELPYGKPCGCDRSYVYLTVPIHKQFRLGSCYEVDLSTSSFEMVALDDLIKQELGTAKEHIKNVSCLTQPGADESGIATLGRPCILRAKPHTARPWEGYCARTYVDKSRMHRTVMK